MIRKSYSMNNQRKQFKQALNSDTCEYPASIFDPISARIAEMVGYKFAMLPGSVASAIALVLPDLVLLTASELATQVRAINRVANLSLIVDADHCFGNALNVVRTVEELEIAGAAAITIEDTVLPRPFREPKLHSIPKPEMIGKLKAAVNTRSDPSFAIVARTISFEQEGPAKAIERIKAYSQTGVDAIFLAGIPRGRKDIIATHKATHLPIIIPRLSKELKDHEFLCENNVRFALNGQPAFRAAIKTTFEIMRFLKDGGDISEIEDKLASNKLFKQITRVEQYQSLQERFLS